MAVSSRLARIAAIATVMLGAAGSGYVLSRDGQAAARVELPSACDNFAAAPAPESLIPVNALLTHPHAGEATIDALANSCKSSASEHT